MRILIFLGHPAHFHLFRHTIRALESGGHSLRILVSGKDVLEGLLQREGLEYTMVYTGVKGRTRLQLLRMLWVRGRRIYKIIRKWNADLMIGTSAEGPLFARLAGIPFINMNEDDYDVVPLYSRLSYPFSTHILMPEKCKAGRWRHKTIYYPGFHELAYLHPKLFQPDKAIIDKNTGKGLPYILLRFSALAAHHDNGKRGITEALALRIIELLRGKYRVFISSEKALPPSLSSYILKMNPLEIHHVMAGARLYIGDSQTMAAECAMLGTPFIRYNDFVGKITYLALLENEYKLGYGFIPGQEEEMIQTTIELLAKDDLREEWMKKRDLMLINKINTADFIRWFLVNYPQSAEDVVRKDYNWNIFREMTNSDVL